MKALLLTLTMLVVFGGAFVSSADARCHRRSYHRAYYNPYDYGYYRTYYRPRYYRPVYYGDRYYSPRPYYYSRPRVSFVIGF